MQLTKEEFQKAVEDETRRRIIVIDTLLEDTLDRLIAQHLQRKDEVLEALTGDNGIRFTDKARLVYLLNLVDKVTMQDLLCLHNIRNRFAHVVKPDFSDGELVKHIQKLSTVGGTKNNVTEDNYMSFYDKAVGKCTGAICIWQKGPCGGSPQNTNEE